MPNGQMGQMVTIAGVRRHVRQTAPPPGAAGEVDSHGSIVSGAGSTTAGDTTIGTVTLPAGGPWIIHTAFGQIAQATATAGESFGGHFRVNSLDGDVQPNPAPSRLPTGLGGSFLGAVQDVRVDQLKLWPVGWVAPGKARLELIYNEASAVTVATQVVLGVMYGKTIPELKEVVFIDRVRAAIKSASDTSIGTVTLAEKASKITAVGCVIAQDGVITAGEELIGFFRLSSDDANMAPSQWPCNAAYSAGLGATVGQGVIVPPVMIPVNIPVPGGARINAFLDLNTALTNEAEVEVFIQYE